MANPVRGEVAFGDTVLRFTTNAICAFEDRAGVGFLEAASNLGEKPSLKTLREFIWTGLQAANPGITVEDAGDRMDEFGFNPSLKALGAAIRLALPPAPKEEPAEKH